VLEGAADTGLYGDIGLIHQQVSSQAESRVHHAYTGNQDVYLAIGGF
jgi:hypothetical protein